MKELIEFLNEKLRIAFEEDLKKKEIQYFEDGSTIDVFKTLMFLRKNNNDLNKLMLQGAVSRDELKYLYGEEILNEAIKNKFIIKGNSINSDKIFLGSNGLYKHYIFNDFNLSNVFVAFDSNNFTLNKELALKAQEKIWCLFLILLGADSEQNAFKTEGLSPEVLVNYHLFFISIENELATKGIQIGNKIGWDSGKDISFRKFITNIVNLSKTPLYKREGYKYYLDLTKRKNAKYLLDLVLEKHKGAERLIANDLLYESLKELELKMSFELGQIPGELNQFIIEELKS